MEQATRTIEPTPNPKTADSLDALYAIRERERFRWFADQLGSLVGRYDADELEALFDSRPTWPGQKEKVVVLMALQGACDSLARLDLDAAPSDLVRLHQVACDEAARRTQVLVAAV